MKKTPQREGHVKVVRGAARNCGVEEELHASAARRSGRALAVEVRADWELTGAHGLGAHGLGAHARSRTGRSRALTDWALTGAHGLGAGGVHTTRAH